MTGNVLFLTEGSNDKAFYSRLWDFMVKKEPLLNGFRAHLISLNGCTRFENKAYGLSKSFCLSHPEERTAVLFCLDTDVFDKGHYERERIDKVAEEIKGLPSLIGVYRLEASPSLERFFLEDPCALGSFLNRNPEECRVDPKEGIDGIKKIFRQAGRYYVKRLPRIASLVELIDFDSFCSLHPEIIDPLLKIAKVFKPRPKALDGRT